MKIAYFTDTYVPEVNGVANTLEKLSGYLERKGISHQIFAPDYDGQALPKATERKTLHRFAGLRVSLSPNSCLAFPRTKAIFDLCDAFAPDLVHVTTEFGIGHKGMKYALARRLPLVMSYHTDYCKYLSFFGLTALEPFAELYLKQFFRASHKTLVPSRFTLEQLRQKGYENLGIWSRGIDAGKFSPAFRNRDTRARLDIGDRFAFLFVGRLSPEKGLHVLLQAAETLERLFPAQTAFVVTGDGPYAQTIRQAGMPNIRMTGFQSGRALSEIYASCDCFAFPSCTETFGNTGLEALASGLPVVGFASGGVTDYLVHGHNALLCNTDDEKAFTENLVRVMQSDALRRELAENGRKTALAKDWSQVFDNLLLEYAAVIQQNAVALLARAS